MLASLWLKSTTAGRRSVRSRIHTLDRATAALESVAIHLDSRYDQAGRNAGAPDGAPIFLKRKTAGLGSVRDGLESVSVHLENVSDALGSAKITLETGAKSQGKAADDLGLCANSLGPGQIGKSPAFWA